MVLAGWTVDNGDDSISTKANSTNILIENCDFYTGLGVAVGSIGQYEGRYEIVENVTARNITINNMRYGAYFKTVSTPRTTTLRTGDRGILILVVALSGPESAAAILQMAAAQV